MSNLLVEIGNTALKAACSEGMTLGKTFRYQGEKMFLFIDSLVKKEKPEVLVLASSAEVSPQNEKRLSDSCSRLVLLDKRRKETIESFGLPGYISPDRAASILAVRHLFKGYSCTVFDFGTTLTIDFVGREGEYRGGNVSPGCRTRFKALNRYARGLPLVETPAEVKEIGDSIPSSMEAGVISGIMFEITGYLSQFPENKVVFTGGDAIYFAKRMKNPIFVICNLVMMGLALIADEHVGKNGI